MCVSRGTQPDENIIVGIAFYEHPYKAAIMRRCSARALGLFLVGVIFVSLHSGALIAQSLSRSSSSFNAPPAWHRRALVRRHALSQKLERQQAANGRQLRRENGAATLTRDQLLSRIPVGSPAYFTVANSAYEELAINWALLLLPLLRREGTEGHAFIAALDDALASRCVARSLPTLRVALGRSDSGLNASGPTASGPTANFRLKFSAFRAYGVTKADLILWLISSGRPVVVSDVDCAWLASPSRLLDSIPEADVLAGTDCLDTNEDDDRSRRAVGKVISRCGHHVGSMWGAWFNTGVLGFRTTPNAISLANEWRERMESVAGIPGENSCDHGCQHAVDDQLTFNQMLWGDREVVNGRSRAEPIYPVRSARDDGLAIFDATGMRVVAPLSARLVCSGHVFHVQQAVERRDCLVMHLTFVEAGAAGKVWRLREAGLWPFDPEPTVGALGVVDEVAGEVAEAAAEEAGQPQQHHLKEEEEGRQQRRQQESMMRRRVQEHMRASQPQLLLLNDTRSRAMAPPTSATTTTTTQWTTSSSEPIAPRRFLSFSPAQLSGPVPPAHHPSLRPGQVAPNRVRDAKGDGWSVELAIRYVPRLAAHLELVDRHIVAIRNAMGVAKALGRELILPRMLCLCERAQQPWGVLPSCLKDGASSTPLPFVCPLENIFDIEELEEMWKGSKRVRQGRLVTDPPYLAIRPWTMLNRSFHPRAPEPRDLAAAVTTVRWKQGVDTRPSAAHRAGDGGDVGGAPRSEREVREAARDGDPHAAMAAAAGDAPLAIAIPLGLTDEGWRAAVRAAGAEAVPVLHLESAHEGAVFGGFEDEAEARRFDEQIASHVVPGTRRFSATCAWHAFSAGALAALACKPRQPCSPCPPCAPCKPCPPCTSGTPCQPCPPYTPCPPCTPCQPCTSGKPCQPCPPPPARPSHLQHNCAASHARAHFEGWIASRRPCRRVLHYNSLPGGHDPVQAPVEAAPRRGRSEQQGGRQRRGCARDAAEAVLLGGLLRGPQASSEDAG